MILKFNKEFWIVLSFFLIYVFLLDFIIIFVVRYIGYWLVGFYIWIVDRLSFFSFMVCFVGGRKLIWFLVY